MHYRDSSRNSWFEDHVEAVGCIQHDINLLSKSSAFVNALCLTSNEDKVSSVRTLSEVKRGADDIRLGDVVLFEQFEMPARIARVVEMMQVVYRKPASDHTDIQSYVRFWCTEARDADLGLDGTLQIDPSKECACMLACLEKVQVSVVTFSHATDTGRHVYQ